jgi:alcohol dehydrogenase class IV
MWTYQHTPQIVFGEGVLNSLGVLWGNLGRRPLIVCGRSSAERFGYVARVVEQLKSSDCDPLLFNRVEENPSFETIHLGADCARENSCDSIVGLGGGSPLDAARAIAALTPNEGSIADYVAGRQFEKPSLPLVMIPTTSGTGSEVTGWSVLTNLRERRKQSVKPPDGWAKLAIIDPELTYSLNHAMTVGSGMDALGHCTEALWTIKHNPISDALAKEALRLIFTALPKLCRDLDDKDSRRDLSLASLLAGKSFSNTMTAGLHALSYGLTSLHGVHHGTSCALLFPPFFRFNAPALGNRLRHFCEAIELSGYHNFPVETANPEQLGAELADVYARFALDCGLKIKLSDYGIPEDAIPTLAEMPMSPNIHNNPRPLTRDDITAIYQQIL